MGIHEFLCTTSFTFSLLLLFSIFPIVKMAANYVEIGSVGKLETDLQVPFFFKFCEFFTILL